MNGWCRRLAIGVVLVLVSGAGFAARGGGGHSGGHSGGHWGGHSHGHSSVGFYFSGGWPYYGPWGYDWPYYYPPYYYPPYSYPSYAAPYAYGPPTYVEQPQQDPAWRYCAALDAYYPYVTECPDGAWSRVSPQPPPGSDNLGPAGAPAR